ncbi:MAG TPA: ribonuclease H [Candidatus Binataceae bacterium]
MKSHAQDREPEILVYADGSCLGNPGPGGWGVVIVGPEGTREFSGGDPRTTNNRMELTAAIEGLRHLLPGTTVLLRSDSQYLVKTINYRWKRNANTDLWKELDAEIATRKVRFEWVRGHAGNALNERADRLALQAAKDAADTGRSLRRGAPAQPDRDPGRAASPPAAPPPAPAPLPQDEATLNVLRPLLKEGEVIRRCIHCGGEFIAPQRYKDSYCALIACQLERRSRPT